MSLPPPETLEEVRCRMKAIREQLADDVGHAIQQVKSTVDWRTYVRAKPLLVLGVAGAVGYLLVPSRKRPQVTVLQADGQDVRRAIQEHMEADRPSLTSVLWSTATAMLTRQAVGFVQRQADTWVSQWLQSGDVSPSQDGETASDKPEDSMSYPRYNAASASERESSRASYRTA